MCLLPSEKLQATAEGVTGEGGPELQHLSLGSRAGYSVNIVVKVITPVVVFVTHTPLPPDRHSSQGLMYLQRPRGQHSLRCPRLNTSVVTCIILSNTQLRETSATRYLHAYIFLRVPWTTRRSDQSILKETSPNTQLRETNATRYLHAYIFLKVPWTTRRSDQSILKETSLNIHWKH